MSASKRLFEEAVERGEVPPPVGTRVKSKYHGETGVIEEYNKQGQPVVRWSYGNLLRADLAGLEVIS
jgi:hypothetical protein